MGKGYDKEKDKILKEWRHKISSERELSLTVRSYNDGDPKLQIGPYIRLNADGEDIGVWGKLGRMDLTELEIIFESIPDAMKFMKKLEKKKKEAKK